MKRTFLIAFICALLCLSLSGCGESSSASSSSDSANQISSSSSSADESASSASASASASTEPANTIGNGASTSSSSSASSTKTTEPESISLGDTVSTKEFDFTLNKVRLSFEVVPDCMISTYHYFAAHPGYVYVYVDADIYNTSKKNLDCSKVYSVNVYYSRDFTYSGADTYSGSAFAEDSKGDFIDANTREISQLETAGVHNIVECPEVVYKDTASALYVVITMSDNSKYEYVLR